MSMLPDDVLHPNKKFDEITQMWWPSNQQTHKPQYEYRDILTGDYFFGEPDHRHYPSDFSIPVVSGSNGDVASTKVSDVAGASGSKGSVAGGPKSGVAGGPKSGAAASNGPKCNTCSKRVEVKKQTQEVVSRSQKQAGKQDDKKVFTKQDIQLKLAEILSKISGNNSKPPPKPKGARARRPGFGNPGFREVYQTPVGTRWCSYAQTPEADCENPGTQPAWEFVSISAMSPYKEKTHEELRWEDYQSGDKGGPNPAGQSSDRTEFETKNTRSNLFSTSWLPATNPFSYSQSTNNPFAQKSSPFRTPTNYFATTQAQTRDTKNWSGSMDQHGVKMVEAEKGASFKSFNLNCCFNAFWVRKNSLKGLQKDHQSIQFNLASNKPQGEDQDQKKKKKKEGVGQKKKKKKDDQKKKKRS